jgi:hypothetical protein
MDNETQTAEEVAAEKYAEEEYELQKEYSPEISKRSFIVSAKANYLNCIEHWQKFTPPPQQVIPYQKCPKCDGQGMVSKPPYVAGDVHQWSSTCVAHVCDVCSGAKIIPTYIPPQATQVSYEEIGALENAGEGTLIIEYSPEKCRLKSKVSNIDITASPEEVIKFAFNGWMGKVKELQQLKAALSHPSAQPKDGWTTEKPSFTKDCLLITAHLFGFRREWEYNIYMVKFLNGYFNWLTSDGEEYGALDELTADKYLVLPLLTTK